MKKTRWVSLPINREEFFQRGYIMGKRPSKRNKEWEKYQKEIPTNGIIYVRREVDIQDLIISKYKSGE